MASGILSTAGQGMYHSNTTYSCPAFQVFKKPYGTVTCSLKLLTSFKSWEVFYSGSLRPLLCTKWNSEILRLYFRIPCTSNVQQKKGNTTTQQWPFVWLSGWAWHFGLGNLIVLVGQWWPMWQWLATTQQQALSVWAVCDNPPCPLGQRAVQHNSSPRLTSKKQQIFQAWM